MSQIISDAQEKAIFTAIPAQVTIGETVINASKIWFNQAITSYPTITLNIATGGIASDIRDIRDGVAYYEEILTIHILTKNQSGLNGSRIAKQFASTICAEIASWVTPLSGDVRIFSPADDIKSIGNLGYTDEVFDYVLSITLYHS